ncbi:(E)-4-hydroxy-3-methylbut-2-enyl-diphosphate synthase [bacterium]|nr:(E)-4-hydroxy-3-methylbut-2-enyl-diphosphate synthase [bacterium]
MRSVCQESSNSYQRRPTRVVQIGEIGVGGANPIRVQSMTIADTMDTKATVDEILHLADAGCEIVRVTAPSINEAENLCNIRAELAKRNVEVPLVADIHYTPNAALIAAEHVEKVRINPGNYADKKKFEQREYTEAEYEQELDRIEHRFKPLVLKCKDLGRAMRIGTNHGSLSDRIMNRYGDTPKGMVESALEFVRICEKYDYRDLVLSMKASNPQVAIHAYRLLAARMEELGMDYPFHLGVTEAGDGEEGRIKSAVGIGSLLEDGIGDTIRVSLTEDSVAEVPVAFRIVKKYNELNARLSSEKSQKKPVIRGPASPSAASVTEVGTDGSNGQSGVTLELPSPFEYSRRKTLECDCVYYSLGSGHLSRVELSLRESLTDSAAFRVLTAMAGFAGNGELTVLGQAPASDLKCEAVHVKVRNPEEVRRLSELKKRLYSHDIYLPFVVETGDCQENFSELASVADRVVLSPSLLAETPGLTSRIIECKRLGRPIEWKLPLHTDGGDISSAISDGLETALKACNDEDYWNLLFSLSCDPKCTSVIGAYRFLSGRLDALGSNFPVLLRYRSETDFDTTLLDVSAQLGSLLCDGIGDAIHLEAEALPEELLRLSYNLLQAARLRISKTEFISCPSCGRTLFNLQSTTERIKSKTDHLKGVKIAIMGCIVNGPGEMADADFGYVGAGPGKVNLFVGKKCVQRNIPEERADEQLIELIKFHGKWVEPVTA